MRSPEEMQTAAKTALRLLTWIRAMKPELWDEIVTFMEANRDGITDRIDTAIVFASVEGQTKRFDS